MNRMNTRMDESIEATQIDQLLQIEGDKWRTEFLKNMVIEKTKAIQPLEQKVYNLECEVRQKNTELNTIREKEEGDVLRMESLQKQVSEKSEKIEVLDNTVKDCKSRLVCSEKVVSNQAKEVEILQQELAEKCKALEILEKKLQMYREHESNMNNKGKRALLIEDSGGLPTTKRTRLENSNMRQGNLGGATYKVKLGESSKPSKSLMIMEESHQERGEFFGSEDFSEDNSQNELSGIFGTRSGHTRVPSRSQSSDSEAEPMQQEEEVSSPTQSDASAYTSDTVAETDMTEVLDNDFNCFDSIRMQKNILPSQVWAIYGDHDGMPRFYVRIFQVFSRPFRVHMNWLDSISEEDIAWTSSTDLSMACGEFKIGTFEVTNNIRIFSHIAIKRSLMGIVRIYPKRNQVWAVYKDWDPEEEVEQAKRVPQPIQSGDRTYSYDMVEIINELCGEGRLETRVLHKIEDSTTLFCREVGLSRFFDSTELMKFSHRVFYHILEDQDADIIGIPRGSLELDSACVG